MHSLNQRPRLGASVRPMLLSACLGLIAVGCQNTQGSTAEEPVSDGNGGDEYEVTVSGDATATREGDTITLAYPEPTDFIDRVPEWVINPTLGGVTGAVGVASNNALGRKEQLDESRLNARIELAAMLELRVQRVGRSELEQDTRIEGGGDASRSRKSNIGIDRVILDSVLAGSRQRALWVDKDTGECYVWMVMDGAVLQRAEHRLVGDVSVFIANKNITSEYRPDRKRFEKPTVIVRQIPDAAPAPVVEPEMAPDPPKTPIEELEGQLKPIETIPQKSDG